MSLCLQVMCTVLRPYTEKNYYVINSLEYLVLVNMGDAGKYG